MSAGLAVDLERAAAIACELRDTLAPACDRIAIAGSIRRLRPQVRDIEIVAIPKIETVGAGNLWGDTVDVDRLEALLVALRESGVLPARDVAAHRANGDVDYGHKLGRAYQALEYRDLPVDLFIVRPPAEWGVIFALRTGPGDWNQRIVTDARERYLRRVDGGQLFAAGAHVPCPEEADFFAGIGQDWFEPEHRHVDRVRIRADRRTAAVA